MRFSRIDSHMRINPRTSIWTQIGLGFGRKIYLDVGPQSNTTEFGYVEEIIFVSHNNYLLHVLSVDSEILSEILYFLQDIQGIFLT